MELSIESQLNGRTQMRALLIVGLSMFLLSAPSVSYADHVLGTVVTTVKENPGKSAGIAGCAAVVIFPPTALWCLATLIGGGTVDGDVQRILTEPSK